MSNFDPKIVVSVDGGLGDHVSAEPAVRYLVESVYPGRQVTVACLYPRVFEHLSVPVMKHHSPELDLVVRERTLHTFPRTGPLTESVCFLTCHMSEYHAFSLMYRMLPLADRTVHLSVNGVDRVRIQNLLGDASRGRLVAVHAGKSWQSKTFPLDWWQDVVDELAREGAQVCLVGRRSSDQSGNTTGVVEVNARPGVIDLRDRLSLGELFALIEHAPVLLSNDSSLVQIAGAFENWIVMPPTCKHPDLVFPYRHGSPQWKTLAPRKRLLVDDWFFEPIRDRALHVDVPVSDWDRYLPDAHNLVTEIAHVCI